MAEIDDIRVALRLELDQFKQDLRGAKEEMRNAGDGMAGSMKGVGTQLGLVKGALGALGIGLSLTHIWRQFAEGEQASIKLRLAIRGTERGGKELTDQFDALAEQMGKVGVVSGTEMKEGLASILSFTTIATADIPRVAQVMADLTARTGNAHLAARLLGNAAEGSTQGFRRYGISISGAAKESGDFKLILADLEQKLKDTNKELGESTSGGFTKLKNQANDLLQELGNLANAAVPVDAAMTGWSLIFQKVAEDVKHARMDVEAYTESIKKSGGAWEGVKTAVGNLFSFANSVLIRPGKFASENPATAAAVGGGAAGAKYFEGPPAPVTASDQTITEARQMAGGLSLAAGINQQLENAKKLLARTQGTDAEKLFGQVQFGAFSAKLNRQLRDAVVGAIDSVGDEASTLEAELTGTVEQQANVRIQIREREYKLTREKMALDIPASKAQLAAFDEAQQKLRAAMELQKQYTVEDKRIETEKEYVGMLQQVRGEEASLTDDYKKAASIRYDMRIEDLRLQQEDIELMLQRGGLLDEEIASLVKRLDLTEQMRTQANLRVSKESRTPLQVLADDWANTTTQMEQATAKWAQQSADYIIDFVKTGKFEFKSFAASIIEDLLRIQIQQALVGGGSSGSSIGGILGFIGGFFAHGGEPTINRVSVVGERGPELIAPKTAMMVTPMSQLGNGKSGSTVVVNTTNNFSLGVQQTVRAEIQSLMPQINESSKRSVLTAINRGGSFTTAVGR